MTWILFNRRITLNMKFSHRQSNKIEFYLISLRKFHWKWTWIELWNITKYIWKHKRHICYTHNHKNLMKQSCCLSLNLCQKYTVKKQSFFPTVSQKLQASQPFANSLHTIYRMCKEEIENPRVGELLESLQNGDGEPTISYRCNALNHDIWRVVTLCILCHLDRCPPREETL